MTLPGLASGLTDRPLRLDDAPAVHAVTAAYERALLGEEMSDLEDFQGDFARPSFDPARDAVLVHDGEDLVAWGEVFHGRRATVVVHPDHGGRGIGGALADWAVRRASEVASDRVGQTVPDADTAAAELLSARAWSPLYTSWVLAMPPGAEIPERSLPDGYRLRAHRPGEDDRAAYEVVEQAFGEWPERDPTSFEDWAAAVLRRPGFEPWQLTLVVTGDDRVVGACHLLVSHGTGWVGQLAVDRAHRGRGLAQALLARAFQAARDRGAPRGELSTDSRTGALSLYERLGMQVTSSYTHWARTLG